MGRLPNRINAEATVIASVVSEDALALR
jgi:hypothetical protein